MICNSIESGFDRYARSTTAYGPLLRFLGRTPLLRFESFRLINQISMTKNAQKMLMEANPMYWIFFQTLLLSNSSIFPDFWPTFCFSGQFWTSSRDVIETRGEIIFCLGFFFFKTSFRVYSRRRNELGCLFRWLHSCSCNANLVWCRQMPIDPRWK